MPLVIKSVRKLQQYAAVIAKETIKTPRRRGAFVIALRGNLGSGKTTFVQGFATALGVQENVLSPTFVLMKFYVLPKRIKHFRHLIHIDCYRLDSSSDVVHLGFRDLLKDHDAIVVIEWAERIRRIVPWDALWITLRHGKSSQERILSIKNQNLIRQLTDKFQNNIYI